MWLVWRNYVYWLWSWYREISRKFDLIPSEVKYWKYKLFSLKLINNSQSYKRWNNTVKKKHNVLTMYYMDVIHLSYLRYLCLFAYSGVSTYCIVFLFCFSSSYVPYVVSFSEMSFFEPLWYSVTFIIYLFSIITGKSLKERLLQHFNNWLWSTTNDL